ncbi:hypothetical protein [Rhodopirellula europaea]|nr:hypothetical protein [Rhodopirellula europaea]
MIFNSAHILTREPAEVYSSYLVAGTLALNSLLLERNPVRSNHVIFLLIVGGVGLLGSLAWPSQLGFIKVYLVLVCVIISSGLVIDLYNANVKRIFEVYLFGCFLFSAIGIVQVAAFRVGIAPLYNFRLYGLNKWGLSPEGPLGIRLNSIFSEPSGFAVIVAAGACWAVASLLIGPRSTSKQGRVAAFTILTAYCLTFSALLVPAFACIALLLQRQFQRQSMATLKIVAIIALLGYVATSSGVEARIRGIRELAGGSTSYSQVHGSSEVLYDHMLATVESLKNNPVIGGGLGMHEQIYDEYRSNSGLVRLNKDEFNRKDANSMFLRTVSELGLVGLMLVVFVYKKGTISSDASFDARLISNACLCVIALQLLRQGNYVYNFFPMFVLIYLEVASQCRFGRLAHG